MKTKSENGKESPISPNKAVNDSSIDLLEPRNRSQTLLIKSKSEVLEPINNSPQL